MQPQFKEWKELPKYDFILKSSSLDVKSQKSFCVWLEFFSIIKRLFWRKPADATLNLFLFRRHQTSVHILNKIRRQ